MTDDDLRQLIERLDAAEAAETDVIQKAMDAITLAETRRTGLQGLKLQLANLFGPVPADAEGLAEACRSALKANQKSMSPIEVRDYLERTGYPLKKHTNPLASIHSVLKQMAESKENTDVKWKEAKDGSGRRYSWVGPKPVPTLTTTSPVKSVDVSALARTHHDLAAKFGMLDKLTHPSASLLEAMGELNKTSALLEAARLQFPPDGVTDLLNRVALGAAEINKVASEADRLRALVNDAALIDKIKTNF